MTDTYWAEREGARWDVYGKQRGWMAQADTEDDARLIVAALTAQQTTPPPAGLAVVPEGYLRKVDLRWSRRIRQKLRPA